VEDHCAAIGAVLSRGVTGETYNIGGRAERTNIEVVQTICAILDEIRPAKTGQSHDRLITHVKDRPGHDRRYAMDTRKIEREIGWKPRETFDSGLRKTVDWYLAHSDWTAAINNGDYRKWVQQNYGERGSA
jgi:dTDP-glucose 4,6-dehydratase